MARRKLSKKEEAIYNSLSEKEAGGKKLSCEEKRRLDVLKRVKKLRENK